jgi:hypothetical protein
VLFCINVSGAAVIDAHRAFKATDKDNKKEPKFRSCRSPVKSFKLQKPNWKQGITYPTHKTLEGIKLSQLKVNPSEELPSEMPSDFSIILASSGEKPHTVFFNKKTPTKSVWDESPSRTLILDGFDFLYIS